SATVSRVTGQRNIASRWFPVLPMEEISIMLLGLGDSRNRARTAIGRVPVMAPDFCCSRGLCNFQYLRAYYSTQLTWLHRGVARGTAHERQHVGGYQSARFGRPASDRA